MWVKKMADGRTIMESAKQGRTWRRTPQTGIVEVFLYHDGRRSPSLTGYKDYWHSRGVVMNPDTGQSMVVADRIQGLREDGQWDTIEFNGQKYIRYVAPKAYGKTSNG
jgi:hypothetical protein